MATVRPFVATDMAALVALSGMSALAFAEQLDHPGIRPETDLLVAESAGSLVAARDVCVMGRGDESPLILESWATTTPDSWDMDTQKQLFEKMLERARGVLTEQSRVSAILQVRASVDDEKARALFTSFDFEPRRDLWTMERSNLADIKPPALPDDIELRAYAPGKHDEAWRLSFNEAFSDHWGGWMQMSPTFWQRYVKRPTFRPDLSLVAWAGDEIAGFCHCRLAEDRKQGGVRYVGVRPKWRRRGLGEALTRAGMIRLREVGVERASLGVDATNTTGAQLLYEKNGFVVTRRIVMYRREITTTH